jgi:hypothetical protein
MGQHDDGYGTYGKTDTGTYPTDAHPAIPDGTTMETFSIQPQFGTQIPASPSWRQKSLSRF